MSKFIAVLVLCSLAGPAGAIKDVIYSCKDPRTGRMTYQNRECAYGAEQNVAQVIDTPDSPTYVPRPKPQIGMTAEEVRQLGLPWGSPSDVNRTTTARGVREQWVYGDRARRYIYFVDGVVTAIQD